MLAIPEGLGVIDILVYKNRMEYMAGFPASVLKNRVICWWFCTPVPEISGNIHFRSLAISIFAVLSRKLTKPEEPSGKRC